MFVPRLASALLPGPIGTALLGALPRRPLTLARADFKSPFQGTILGRFQAHESDLFNMVPFKIFIYPLGDLHHLEIDVATLEKRLESQPHLLAEVRTTISEIPHPFISPFRLDLLDADPFDLEEPEPADVSSEDPQKSTGRFAAPNYFSAGGGSGPIGEIRSF